MGDADHPAARVAPDLTEGVELFDEHAAQAALLLQHTIRGRRQRVAEVHESARQRVGAGERRLGAAQQQRVQRTRVQRQQGDVDRQVWVRVVVELVDALFHARSIYLGRRRGKGRPGDLPGGVAGTAGTPATA